MTNDEKKALANSIRARGKPDGTVYWHGSPSGDLRGGKTGLHIGTRKAATQALEARIGVPAEGEWDGTRPYGTTKLAGQRTLAQLSLERGYDLRTGVNAGYRGSVPDDDYYPDPKSHTWPRFSDGTKLDENANPSVRPYKISGPMSNSRNTPYEDFKANGYMQAQKTKGTAKRGMYYTNVGEDSGSISAVVPNGDHLEPQ